MRGWRGFALLLTVLLLQACSAVKLAYNQAPTLLYWRLDSYADFSDAQSERVHQDLARYLLWHRRQQLPLYADLLQRIRPQLSEPISAEQACQIFEQARSALDGLLDPSQWTLIWLAGELSEEQLQHIERKQASSNAQWRKEWLGLRPEQLLEQRFEQILSRSEMLYGSLDDAQQAALRAALTASSVFDAQLSYAARLRLQQDLLQTLRQIRRERLEIEPARVLLRAYMARAVESPDLAHRRYQQALIREGCAVFSRLHNATTPAQRAQAMQTLKRYEDDFRQLASQR
jgi:Family of unknown function (DUF6279)